MGLFGFINGWKDKLVREPLTRKMQHAANVGEQTLIPRIHVVSGYMKSTSGVMFRQSDMTILTYFDAPYALIELARGGPHDALNPTLKAMAAVFGGTFEVHFPNATISKKEGGLARMRQSEVRLHSALGGGRGSLGQRTRFYSRRWHKRAGLIPQNPTTPLV